MIAQIIHNNGHDAASAAPGKGGWVVEREMRISFLIRLLLNLVFSHLNVPRNTCARS